MQIDTSPKTIENILNRGVNDINVKEDLRKLLQSGKQLRVYMGIDPSGFDLTLGHAVPLRKMKQFQDAGHHIILLIGSFTAQIGDPTGKSQTRKVLTKEQVLKNAKDYAQQANKIIDMNKVEIVYNHEWLESMSFADVLRLGGSFTVQQMLHRDMFQKRMENKQEINLIEFFYPLMQGYDAVHLEADIQIGGNDQLFNLMAGRVIAKHFEKKQQQVITTPILVGLDGKEKMSKSLGNYIALEDNAKDMFGKIMSIPDECIIDYFELATEIPMEEVKEIRKQLEGGEVNPRDIKVQLAKEIITLYHSKAAADEAEEIFINTFQKNQIPDDIEEKNIDMTIDNATEIIFILGLAESKGEARRAIRGGGAKVNGEKITDENQLISLKSGMIFQVGKRKWAKIA